MTEPRKEYPTDYKKSGTVTLKKKVFSVMIITEKEPLILNNGDINEFYFIEDIFKFCMVGSITFNDRYNIIEYGPFTGNEKLAVIYSIEGDEKSDKNRELIFDIWKVGRVQQIGSGIREESENLITMNFIDPFYAGFTLRKYSRSWSNRLYTDIMKDILNNMVFFKQGGRPFNVEASRNKTDFVIPYWTPQMAVRWLMRRAKGETAGTGGYLCFNNTNKTFSHNLVTMNYLLSDYGKTFDPVAYVFNQAKVSSDNKILEWWMNGLDLNSNAGIRGGTWKGYDFSTKKLLNYEHVYSDGTDNTVMLGRQTLYNKIDDIQSSNILTGDSSDNLLENISYNDWAKRYNMQMVFNIIVEGNEKRFAGQQIEIKWPSWARNLGSEVQYNDLFKGKYLIKSVTHSFNPGGTYPYKQRLVLIKNAYTNINSKFLHKAKESNIYQEGKVRQILRR
jgi:hypothetical protein